MFRVSTGSVRFRVTALAVALVAFLLVAVAVILVVVQHRALTAAVDDGLRRRADDLAVVVAETVPDTLSGADDDHAAQIVTPGGEVLVASVNLPSNQPIASDPGGLEVVAERLLADPDDAFRVLSRSVTAAEGRLIIHVATAADEISDSVDILRNSLLVLVPLAIASLAAASWWLVGRALNPVEAIRTEVTTISETDLDRRVPVPDTDDEISRLAVTMNLMLDRLEDGVSRLQRFVADASHELRSPLTRMRTELEVDLANPDQADPEGTHRSVLEEVGAMQRLVDELLYLARSDAGEQSLLNAPVDLDDLLLDEADRLRPAGLTIDISRVSAGQVLGDRAQLVRMIRNLVDNAARHAMTAVTFQLGEDEAGVVLAVSDDGPGIPLDQAEHVFRRFARVDESRSREEGGSGVGLAIVRDIVERHGGTVVVDTGFTTGARLIVRLPASRP